MSPAGRGHGERYRQNHSDAKCLFLQKTGSADVVPLPERKGGALLLYDRYPRIAHESEWYDFGNRFRPGRRLDRMLRRAAENGNAQVRRRGPAPETNAP